MPITLKLICFVIFFVLQSFDVSAQPTVIVVRHGEKLDNTTDTLLSPQGEARAARLANMLAMSKSMSGLNFVHRCSTSNSDSP